MPRLLTAVVAAMAAAAAPAAADSVQWTSCSPSSGAVGHVTGVTASPYPLVQGKNSTLTLTVDVEQAVQSGKFDTVISYEGINLYTGSGSICELAADKKCPIDKGSLALSSSEAVSSSAPAGTYNIKFSGANAAGDSVFCANMKIDVVAAAAEEEEEFGADAFAAPADEEPVNNEAFINYVNSKARTWTAGHNERWNGLNYGHVRNLCGSKKEPEGLRPPVRTVPAVGDIPASFDSRTQWGSVCPSVKDIRDQGSCGSCYAVSSAEVMTDRTCIASNGTVAPYLTSEDPLSCCGFFCGSGCGGGFPSAVLGYWVSTGVVTGGPYGSGQGCQDYGLPMCEHHVSGPLPPCTEGGATPSCNKTCQNGEPWAKAKHFGKTSYSISSDVEQIQREIMTNGPVVGTFTVYADFPTYKSGVYQHTSGAALGGHAIKIIGWGEENGTPYWAISNSWNAAWGSNFGPGGSSGSGGGYFLILRGSDECGIESGIVAGMPKLD